MDLRYEVNSRHGVTTIRDGMDKGSSLEELCDPSHVHRDIRLITVYIDFRRFRTKILYIFSQYSMLKVGKSKGMCDI